MGTGWEALAYDVVYTNGEQETVKATMRARLEVERRWPPGHTVTDEGKVVLNPDAPGMEATLLVAWWSKHSPPELDLTKLDEWAGTISSIHIADDPVAENGEPVDPSPPAAGAG